MNDLKEYRLIQLYPSIPSWFKEGYTVHWEDTLGKYSVLHPKTGKREFSLTKSEVENNPEFWERIKEPKEKSIP